jgi:hypothetical protein
MKKNPAFARFLRSTIAAGLGKIDALDRLGHPFLRGRLREVFIQDILRAMTPEIFGILSGKLIDDSGMESAETDVIVFQRNYLPFIPIDQESALIPIENCRYAMEIKTNLRSDTMKSTNIKARKFANLIHNPMLYSRIRFVLIGLGSPTKSKKQWMVDLERLYPDTPVSSIPKTQYQQSMFPGVSIIVSPQWYIYFGQRKPESDEIGWQISGPFQGIEESMREFLVGYVNTLATPPDIWITPNFGGYLRE